MILESDKILFIKICINIVFNNNIIIVIYLLLLFVEYTIQPETATLAQKSPVSLEKLYLLVQQKADRRKKLFELISFAISLLFFAFGCINGT